MQRIYTVGYGDKKFEDLIGMLDRVGVKRVIDVRSFPTSKWSEYKKENLQVSLPEVGIDYVHLRKLGGYRKGGYENYMRSDDFLEGLNKLLELAREMPTSIMCLESYPSGCHRRFIAQKLEGLGWEVIHLVGRRGKIVRQ